MELGLKGKVVVVTGAARGIGRDVVEGFAREGASVVVSDILADEASQLVERLSKSGVKALAVKTDVTIKSDADDLVAAALKEYGKIDILVNSAGIVQDMMFVDIEEADWDRVLGINAKGTYLITRAVLPHMMAARYGKIVNISSRAGKDAHYGMVGYGASKFAVIGLTTGLAKEMAEYDINVNAVCPGILRTAMWEKILDIRSARTGILREEVFTNIVNTIPLKRPQELADVTSVVLFLSSEISRNITGESININGGLRMD